MDKLNVLSFDRYFGEMELSESQKKMRIEEANQFEEMMFFIFELVSIMSDYQYINKEYLEQELKQRYLNIVEKYSGIDDYVEDYAKEFASLTIRVTLENLSDDYYKSEDRAILIAENEANSNINYFDMKQAVEEGKTKKRWKTQRDKKVRETHKQIDGQEIDIEDAFLVGDSLMRFPKDIYYGASLEEIAGCRCVVEYL